MTEFLSERMKKVGLEVEQPEGEKDRYNVIGRLRGSGEGQSLILNGHVEHNMVGEGWTKDPFGAVIEDGWKYILTHPAGYLALANTSKAVSVPRAILRLATVMYPPGVGR